MNKIIVVEIEDDDIDSILDPNDHSIINPNISNAFVSCYTNFAFIPKDQVNFDEFKDKNIILFEIEKIDENEFKSEYEKVLEKISKGSVFFEKMYFGASPENKGVLCSYLQLGKDISKVDETINFVKLIESISNSKSPYLDYLSRNFNTSSDRNSLYYENTKNNQLPFIFVCASSGTGKTQLPFSLNLPLVYLINNSSILNNHELEDQLEIYKKFFYFSKKFLKCIESDRYAIYDKDFRNNLKGCLEDCESMIAGFFVTLFDLIIKRREKSWTEEHWAVSQLNSLKDINSHIKIKKIRVCEAKSKILNMFSKSDTFPLVFLDESQKTDDTHFTLDYKTIRKIIRNIGLIPVFMGTNANLENFISIGSLSGSRSESVGIWAYVVFKLAHPTPDFLKSEKLKLNDLVDESTELNVIQKENAKLFVENIVSLLKKERPFFAI